MAVKWENKQTSKDTVGSQENKPKLFEIEPETKSC